MVKNLPAIQETGAGRGGGGGGGFNPWLRRSPEEGMATHSSILAWEIQWTEEPGGLQSMGSQRVRHDLATTIP